jgi:serine/threonine protein phosphatase PrpC
MSETLFGITDLGRQRQNNEDAFVAQPAADKRYLVGCVIDGVGGYSGGESAASIARDTISQRLDKLSGDVLPALKEAFVAANEKIWQERHASRQHSRMACVLSLAVADLSANQFYYAHLGDTRLYLFRDGSLVKISHDQSFVGFLEDSGRLTEKEAMQHPKRNEIDSALGFKASIHPDEDVETGQSPFLPGDLLLLCSDGLTDMVNKATITAALAAPGSLESVGTALINAANQHGGKDNVTVVLIKNDKARQQHQPTKPVENAKMTKQNSNEKVSINPKVASASAPRKTYSGWAIFFSIIAAGLAVLCVAQYLSGNTNAAAGADSGVVRMKPRNAQEVKLLDAINKAKGKLVILSDTEFKSPIVITHSITISRDSLYIKAKGTIVLEKDSTLKEPGIILTTTTRNIVLDSITFQNFGVAIQSRDRSLQLRNVRFKDCLIPVFNSFILDDRKYINGGFSTPLFKADTVPTKSK